MSRRRQRERDCEYQRRRRAAGLAWWDQQPENAERVRARKLRYYHKPYGGYYRRRKNDLAAQRAVVLTKLAELAEERIAERLGQGEGS